MIKIIHETGEETAASESVAHLSEPDVEGARIAHFERIVHRKVKPCVLFSTTKLPIVPGSCIVQFNILIQLNKSVSINVPAHLKVYNFFQLTNPFQQILHPKEQDIAAHAKTQWKSIRM